MKINLHIGRIILTGIEIPQAQRGGLQASFEAELSRLLIARGLSIALQSSGAVFEIRASDIQVSSLFDPAQLGRQIAHSVYRGIGQ